MLNIDAYKKDRLDQELVFKALEENGINFFVGVPDSHLNGFCNYAYFHYGNRGVVAANEGNAVAIAAGHYFASKEIPLVFLQNSGMGCIVNPLVSLADKHVYSVPMILLIGWRGQPGTGDWPQHEMQGEITPDLLDAMHIPYTILDNNIEHFRQTIRKAGEYCKETRQPYGLISPIGVMMADKLKNQDETYPMSREEAIEVTLDHMPKDTIYCATTGRATRELFYLRDKRGESKKCDFLNVGSMGHAGSVGLGIALERPERQVVVLDGDSAAIMHMGALTMMSKLNVPNYLHIVLNNGAHESVGGLPSAGHKLEFTAIAEACGYQTTGRPATTRDELIEAINELKDCGRAGFIDCRIHKGIVGKLHPLVFSHREAADALIEELNH